jgi:hypothetical protein
MLFTRTRLIVAASRTAIAGVVAAGALVISMGVAVPTSGAAGTYSASEAAFCKTLIGFSAIYAKDATPVGTGLTAYHAWAKKLIPLYEQLAAEAPNATTQKLLGEIVTILKDYDTAGSLSKLQKFELANHATYLKGTKALVAAITGCAAYA